MKITPDKIRGVIFIRMKKVAYSADKMAFDFIRMVFVIFSTSLSFKYIINNA